MDKKNVLIGVLLLGGAFALMVYQGKQPQEQLAQQENAQKVTPAAAELSALTEESSPSPPARLLPSTANKSASNGLFEVVTESSTIESTVPLTDRENIYSLENDEIKVDFTTHGGAIKEITFKNFPITQKNPQPFVFNAHNNEVALGIRFTGENGKKHDFAPSYRLVSQNKDRILFLAETEEGVQVYRGFSISQDGKTHDPYLITHETRFVNNSNHAFNLKNVWFNLGSFPPTQGDAFGEYLNVGYYNGKKVKFIKIREFLGSSGFLGMGRKSPVDEVQERVWPLVWASVKNQFFTTVLTPNEPASGIYATTMDVGLVAGEEGFNEGITGSMVMELGQMDPGNEKLIGMEYYVGPKEYTRLSTLGKDQDLVMQFGFFGIISKFLLIFMTGVHAFIPNWGLTIIIVTIIIKLLLWPLTAIQVRSSKRMAKIQGPLKKLKEKYKDNPQKMQTETMKLFKENRVNPAAGCLPLLVQLPIFLGLYFMLRTSSELRFAPFLWIQDLSLADTITHIGGSFPLNILPLIMATSMFFQMKMTPTPTTDNTQRIIFKFMPFIFLIFCYNFPSGLVLYWTAQNLLTIFQQYVTNKMKDPLDDLPVDQPKKNRPSKASSKKSTKKSTPKKRPKRA